MDGPTPRSLILDLLSTLRPHHTLPVGLLVEAGALFDLAGGTIRVALARLLSSGRVERDERGAYRLSEAALPVQETVGRWRTLDTEQESWDGSFWAVHVATRPRGAAGRRHDQALRLHGLAELEPSFWVRPANLVRGGAALRESLGSLGLAADARVFTASDLDPRSAEDARGLWDVEALRAGYRASLDTIAQSEARLASLEPEAAMRESFLVGGRVLQQLALDPKLPAAILDPADRRALTKAMRGYDRRGREAWSALLARFDVPHRQAPADAGFDAHVDRIVAA